MGKFTKELTSHKLNSLTENKSCLTNVRQDLFWGLKISKNQIFNCIYESLINDTFTHSSQILNQIFKYFLQSVSGFPPQAAQFFRRKAKLRGGGIAHVLVNFNFNAD